MTSQEREKITKRMLWIIPAMIPCIIGDYCMGLEPKNSTAVSFMISTGWLTIADWRIALSNIGGLIGTALYMVAALAFVRYLNEKLARCGDKWSRRFLKLYIAGLYWGCMVFIYFHLACGTLIHNYNVIYEAAQGDTARAVAAWNRSYTVQAVPYWVSFVVLGITSTGGWIAIILRGVLPLKKLWVLAAPLLIAGIGFLLEWILPLPFNGFASGFESFGWIVMFLGGIQAIKKDAVGIRNGAVGMVHLYDPEVQERVVKLGLTTMEEIRKRSVRFKSLCLPGYLIYVLLCVYALNGARGFWPGFWQAFVILSIMNLIDRFLIDEYWVGHTKAWIIPGTEDLRPYITAKDKQRKWIMGTVGMALIAAVLSGIMALILK